MMNLRVCDVPLRGRGFTLFAAANECGISQDLLDFLAISIYPEYEEGEPSYELHIPSKVKVDVFDNHFSETYHHDIHDLEEAGLLTVDGEFATLTPKAEEIFNRASEIKKKLDAEGFSHCPCHNC